MWRWCIGFVIVLLACMPIFPQGPVRVPILQDRDTTVLLRTLRTKPNPLIWFTEDWPLHNHFYRPVPALAFEIDNALHPDDPKGFLLTNALIVVGAVLSLFWFLRELTDRVVLSTLSTSLFATWIGGRFVAYGWRLLFYSSFLALLVALFLSLKALIAKREPDSTKPWKPAGKALAAALVLWYALVEVGGELVGRASQLRGAMLYFLPSRTASLMAVFALMALAAYARYERTSAKRLPKEPSPLNPPATKATRQATQSPLAWIWAVAAVLFGALAFCSYEQAVMLPAVFLGVAVIMFMQGYQVRWRWQAAFWLLLLGYLVVRKEILPPGISAYQAQQLRYGWTVADAIGGYLLPPEGFVISAIPILDLGIGVLFIPDLYLTVLAVASMFAAFVAVRKRLPLALAGWGLSTIAFLPMAWVKYFAWYHFWPMAFRSLFAITVAWVGYELLISAVLPQPLQAPPRPDPAPGSLPRQSDSLPSSESAALS